MKKIVISGPISVQAFEARLERKAAAKTLHSMTASEVFLTKIDKEKRRFIIGKTGRYGISGGQMYFYGNYSQQENDIQIVGKFDMPAIQKAVMYIMFIAVFLPFILNADLAGVWVALTVIVYHVFLFLLYKVLCSLSVLIFRKRNDSVMALLEEILRIS